jgi:membrane protein implicated in regulation of membrane protease activity
LKHVIFTIIAFILAIPILLILPVGLSWSGKIAALIIALLLSLLALVAKSFFPMWQLVLLLGLLMIAMTYLLHRQFAHVFYAAEKMDDDEDDELEEQEEQINNASSFATLENTDMLHEEEAVRVDEEIVPQTKQENNVSQKSAAVEQEEIITVDELPLEIAADIDQIETTAAHEFPWENEKTEQSEMVEISKLSPAVVTEEKQAEAATESGLPWETAENVNTDEAEKLHEWPFEMETNIEQSTDIPFYELPPTVTPEMEENLVVADGAKEMAERDGEENRLHISPEEWMVLTDPLAGEENDVEWDDILSEKTESQEVIQPSFSSGNEEMLQEKTDEKAQRTKWHVDELSQENEYGLEEEEQVIAAKENDVNVAEHVSAISPVQSEILQTVVTELQLNRKYMDPLEYEQRIIQCLQTPLPDYDYYVFACLLIEHYLLEKQYSKLASLLAELKEKFHSYPMIQEEIEFLTHTLQKL